ncbi:histone methyltransferase set2 [Nowakowskiella sp. JEL0078]|nr:histone methyltransferase set2 [Nowakowskiella sp. JEL0078]
MPFSVRFKVLAFDALDSCPSKLSDNDQQVFANQQLLLEIKDSLIFANSDNLSIRSGLFLKNNDFLLPVQDFTDSSISTDILSNLDVVTPTAISAEYNTPRSPSLFANSLTPPPPMHAPRPKRTTPQLNICTTPPPRPYSQPPSATSSTSSTSTTSTIQFPAADMETWRAANKTYTHILENQFKGGANGRGGEDSMPCGCGIGSGAVGDGMDLDERCGDERCINRALFVECDENCVWGKGCQNRRFQRRLYAPLEVFRADKKGFGLRATGPIRRYFYCFLKCAVFWYLNTMFEKSERVLCGIDI